jgi:hypothetical protein
MIKERHGSTTTPADGAIPRWCYLPWLPRPRPALARPCRGNPDPSCFRTGNGRQDSPLAVGRNAGAAGVTGRRAGNLRRPLKPSGWGVVPRPPLPRPVAWSADRVRDEGQHAHQSIRDAGSCTAPFAPGAADDSALPDEQGLRHVDRATAGLARRAPTCARAVPVQSGRLDRVSDHAGTVSSVHTGSSSEGLRVVERHERTQL